MQVLLPEDLDEVNEAVRKIHESGHVGYKALWKNILVFHENLLNGMLNSAIVAFLIPL